MRSKCKSSSRIRRESFPNDLAVVYDAKEFLNEERNSNEDSGVAQVEIEGEEYGAQREEMTRAVVVVAAVAMVEE